MEYAKLLLLLICVSFISQRLTAPVVTPAGDEFCAGNDLLKYQPGQEHIYDYKTKTSLWINDISDESKSSVDLQTTVIISKLEGCKYLMRLEGSALSGDSISQDDNLIRQLNDNAVVFRFNSEGEIDAAVDFANTDLPWSRNIKRGILTALQTRSEKNLRNFDLLDESNDKSATLYETDVLGRCRTTYSLENKDYVSGKSMRLTKRKSLHACSANAMSKSSAVQFKPYRNLPEFNDGRLFVEKFDCEVYIKDNLVNTVECEEEATYKIGSRGFKGVQAVVKSKLTLKSVNPAMNRMNYVPENTQTQSIVYEFTDKSTDDSEYRNFDVSSFMDEICRDAKTLGLSNQHSNNFRSLANKLESNSAQELVDLYLQAKGKCELAGLTFSQALIFANTEQSLLAAIKLIDNDEFKSQKYITEYPILTALARLQDPSETFISNMKTYLASKSADFPYLKKLYLVYSTLVKTHCEKNECSNENLENWSSLFAANLGSNCADSSKKDLVTSSLKAIGNIGYYKDANTLLNCASNKDNEMQVRVSAVEAFRRFSCENFNDYKSLVKILRNTDEDTELRLSSFLALVKCSDTEAFLNFVKNNLVEFFEKEEDPQVLTFIIDYAKEHGLTSLLNPILANPRIRERFAVNFKELSWNRFRYRYSVMRDGALESEASMIYTPNTFIPRSVRFNVTLHLFGMSVNFAEATLRIEGVSDYLKGRLMEKLSSEEVLKKLMEQPEQLMDILKIVADKLKFVGEKPQISLGIRVYGAEVFYSELDDMEELRRLVVFLRSPKEHLLYKQIDKIRNVLLVDSRVRKPLVNGLEFNTFMDVSLGLLTSKNSKKDDSTGKRDFDINNFYSFSLAVNKKFEVLLNKDNRLSLKKKAFANARLRLDVSGTKTNGSATYNLDLSPQKEIPLFVLDGKFYKLGKNSQYTEVTNFNVERYSIDKCTSPKFFSTIGIELCASVKRPKIGSLFDAFRPVDIEKSLNFLDEDDDEDDDDDDDDENDGIKRPRLTLSGPYHYELVLKNPDQIKTFTFDAKLVKDDGTFDFKGRLQSKSQSGSVSDRLDVIYLRKRVDTNRAWDRNFNLELRVPSTGDVRFKLAGDLTYVKKELINMNFILDNKILKEYLITFKASREVQAENVIPTYKLEAVYDSKLRDKESRLMFHITPTGKNIKADLTVEAGQNDKAIKLIEAVATLDHNNENSDSVIDYTVDLKIDTARNTKIRLYGDLVATMFKSNIKLSLEYDSKYFKLASPALIIAGHSYDGNKGAKSYVQFGLVLPSLPVRHSLKILFELNTEKFTIESVEFQINTPQNDDSDTPYKIFIGKHITEEDQNEETEYVAGIRNFNIDLSNSKSGFVSVLTKVDGSTKVNSLVVGLKKIKNKDAKTVQYNFEIRKNDNKMASLEAKILKNFDLQQIRSSSEELPRQTLEAALNLRILEHSGGIQAKLNLENSKKKDFKSYSLDFQTESILKFIIKISSVNFKLVKDNGKLNAQFEIVKLGDLRSLKLTSKSNIRSSGDSNEFDVDYEKNLANGEVKKASGVVKYTFKDFKNLEARLDIPDCFNFDGSIANSRSDMNNLFGEHDFAFRYAHLDYQPIEKQFRVQISNKTEKDVNFRKFNVLAKSGVPSQLADMDKLDYIIDLVSENSYVKLDVNKKAQPLVGKNTLRLKLKSFNVDVDIKQKNKLDLKTKMLDYEETSLFKVPAVVTEPGKVKQFSHKITYNKNMATQKADLKFEFESDSKLPRYKRIDLTYTREVLNKVNNINADLSVKKQDDAVKNVKLSIESDCTSITSCKNKLSIKQDALAQIESKIASGKTIEVTDCVIESRLNRVKETAKRLFDLGTSVNCNGKVVYGNLFYYSITYPNQQDLPSIAIKLSSQSDIYGFKRYFELNHDKFSPKSGLNEVIVQNDKFMFGNKLTYQRDLEQTSGKLTKGKYTLKTSFGPDNTKTCELKIESNENYYNVLNCDLISSKMPISYGYALKVDDAKEWPFGKRQLQLDVNIPGRTVRVDYKANHATPIDTTDDDNDDNNEREFNATCKIFWDFAKSPEKYITVNLKRDNYAKGSRRTTVNIVNTPTITLKSLNIMLDRQRGFNETKLTAALGYELVDGRKNVLKVNGMLNSDSDSNMVKAELNLDRPEFNTQYENRFNKNDGKLQHLGVRVGKLIKLNIEKDDPEHRKISMQLANPDESQYAVEKSSKCSNGVHTVETKLKQGGSDLAKMTSKFDSNDNTFDVKIECLKRNKAYSFNFGIFNESTANAIVTEEVGGDKRILGVAQMKVEGHDDHEDLILNLKWNRFWNRIKIDAMNLPENRMAPNEKYNSLFGDVYDSLSDELKPAVENVRNTRKMIGEDFKKVLFLNLDFYTNFYPKLKEKLMAMQAGTKEIKEEQPLYKRVFERYNSLAQKLTSLNLKLRKISKPLSKYIPRLPVLKYNPDTETKNIKPFANDLTVSRPTFNALTLYQFNAEYRDYVRKMGNNILNYKGNSLRDLDSLSVKGLINKYKLRKLSDYTMVATVFNRRNVIAFNGEAKPLKAKCKYLLAHELRKNQFSVILNLNDKSGIITVGALGQAPIDISYTKASVGEKDVALPYYVKVENKGKISVTRSNSGVCLTVNNDLKVCCYEDSKSCTVALTRWYTGRVNGLLGRSNNNLDDGEEDQWYLDNTCKLPNNQFKKPTTTAVKSCHIIFGKHRQSFFRSSFMLVRPNGWQKICESALSADPNNKCSLMKAFVHHSKARQIEVDEPNECYKCNINDKAYKIGERVPESVAKSSFEKGSDFVFVLLPCDKNKYSLDLTGSIKKMQAKFPGNRYYMVKVDENDASIYQTESSEMVNADMKKAFQSFGEDKSVKVNKEGLYKGLYLAGTLLTNRLATSRHIVIVSCGNCLSYSALPTLRLEKLLDKRNIVISAWGDYEMSDNSGMMSDEEKAFGYSNEHVFLYKPSDNSVSEDDLNSYKLEHKGDLCNRLAVKTEGNVFDIKFMRRPDVFEKTIIMLQKNRETFENKFENKLEKCERVDTPFGDVDDFKYTRTEVETN